MIPLGHWESGWRVCSWCSVNFFNQVGFTPESWIRGRLKFKLTLVFRAEWMNFSFFFNNTVHVRESDANTSWAGWRKLSHCARYLHIEPQMQIILRDYKGKIFPQVSLCFEVFFLLFLSLLLSSYQCPEAIFQKWEWERHRIKGKGEWDKQPAVLQCQRVHKK